MSNTNYTTGTQTKYVLYNPMAYSYFYKTDTEKGMTEDVSKAEKYDSPTKAKRDAEMWELSHLLCKGTTVVHEVEILTIDKGIPE